MRQFGLLLYTLWAGFCFIFLFLLLFPFVFICLQREDWKRGAHWCNWLWAQLFFAAIGMPIEIRYEEKPNPKQAYVFAPNHFSYLDIAVMMMVVRNYFAYMGKSDVKNVPLFGYMFAKLHIQVDRSTANSRAKALQRSLRALSNGRSIVIFPEGGIKTHYPPQLHHTFKDGAFRMAIQQKVPLVPITLLNNYKRLPDNGKPRLRPGIIKIIVHKAIDTQDIALNEENVELLKDRVYRIINSTLIDYTQAPNRNNAEFKRVTII